MLLIDTYLDRSPIHGIGVFAAKDVAEGALIWRFDAVIDRIISLDEYAALPPRTQAMVRRHAEFFADEAFFLLSGDDDRFMNHSDTPNTRNADKEVFAATRISKHQELTCDYRIVYMLDFPFRATAA